MKVTGSRNEPLAPLRTRGTGQADAPATAARSAPADSATFLGVPRAEMTPAVQGAITSLLSEIDGLRAEVGQLKGRLAQAESLADRDTLTPLLNRRAFVRELGRVSAFAQRYDSPASLVYFDLDGFKAINDRQGHAVGDAALQAVAERLSANVRESDVLGRMGGDEFALILVQSDQARAEAKAASLADAVERDPVDAGGVSVQLRVSYGVREISPDVDPETLVSRADGAMYDAKRSRKAG